MSWGVDAFEATALSLEDEASELESKAHNLLGVIRTVTLDVEKELRDREELSLTQLEEDTAMVGKLLREAATLRRGASFIRSVYTKAAVKE